MSTDYLRVPAIEVKQSLNRRLYTFAVDGKQLPKFTTISRIHRDSDSEVGGYQRPEVISHIAAIRRYLESEDPLVPNALVVAFNDQVKFEASDVQSDVDYATPGTLVIPIDPEVPDEDKPGWIVDGQQRSAALREADLDRFPISVVSFIASSDAEQRAQFILVNATKPLPKSLIYELLPSTEGELPELLQRRRLPARLLERLNFDLDSPLGGMIQTATAPDGVIKDNSMLKALENSITDGALYRFRDPATGDGDVDQMLEVLKPFWTAVELTFPQAWDLPPRKSRLMHGAGIVSLSFLFDAMADPLLDDHLPNVEEYVAGLKLIEPACAWTSGFWEFGDDARRKWNEIQNTPRDVQLLASFLLFQYRKVQDRRH